jgi:hypothetical protein
MVAFQPGCERVGALNNLLIKKKNGDGFNKRKVYYNDGK